MSTFFEVPAYKLAIGDLSNAREESGRWRLSLTSDSLNLSRKLAEDVKKELELNLIWIQGTVLNIINEGQTASKTLLISDSTGEAFIHDYTALPGGDHPLVQNGSYVGILGQIWSVSPQIVLKGAKLMVLKEQQHQKIWQDEVTMSKAFLLNILVPQTLL